MKTRIIGIDPGTNHFACSVLDWDNLNIKLLDIKSYKYDPTKILEDKLKLMYEDIKIICEKWNPDIIAIEGQFFGRNVRTLRSLCESVGAIKVSVLNNSDAVIHDYAPTELKLALTGNGQAKKDIMIDEAEKRFNLNLTSDNADEADSIAAGLAYIMFNAEEPCFNMLSPLLGVEYTLEILEGLKSKPTKSQQSTNLIYKKDIYYILEIHMKYDVDSELRSKLNEN